MTTDETAIRSLLDQQSRATSSKDTVGSLAAFAADVVKYDIAPPLSQRGAEANDPKALEQWFASWRGPIGLELTDVTVRCAGDLAFCYGFLHMSGTRTDGEQTDIWIRSTICLEKRAGAWQIVHEHTSVPLRMDGSGKAATDLEP
jgi:ketosteroid isomerase-like protein